MAYERRAQGESDNKEYQLPWQRAHPVMEDAAATSVTGDRTPIPSVQIVCCLDSPGFGGSEIDFVAALRSLGGVHTRVLCPTNISPELARLLNESGVSWETSSPTKNSAANLLTGTARALMLLAKYRHSVFILWLHHCDSNRWLQLVLALTGRTFAIAERLVPASSEAFSRSRLSIPIKRIVCRSAAWVVLNAGSQTEVYKRIFGLKQVRLKVVQGGRPIREIECRVQVLRSKPEEFKRQYGLSHRRIVLCVARLDCEQKRQHDLLEAFSLLDVEHRQHAHVVLVGDGPDERRLKATVRLLGLDGTVTFAGFQRDPLPWLAAADIFVLASASEGLPGVVIEAMAAMVPCVVTDIPGNNELVYDRHTGLLVPVGQPKKMAEAMQILLRDGEFAAQLADRAFAHVRSKYDIELERKQWSALKSELCERRLERSQ